MNFELHYELKYQKHKTEQQIKSFKYIGNDVDYIFLKDKNKIIEKINIFQKQTILE